MPTNVVPPSSLLCARPLERLHGTHLPGPSSCCFLPSVAVVGGGGDTSSGHARGEKQPGGSAAAAALGQTPHAGQGQVGAGRCRPKLF